MKEFITSAQEVDEDQDEGTTFMVDDRECRCYKPSSGQMAVLIASVSRSQEWTSQVAGIINFFVEVLDEPSHQYIVARLLDRNDPFGIDEVQTIIEWMVEEWTGRPIPSPSVSTPSRQNGGRKSTPRTRVST